MQLASDLTPHDRVHLDSDLLAVGSFRLGCDESAFGQPKALQHHHIVLPRTAMGIVQDRRARFVADPVMATLHAPGVAYWREPIAGAPDDSDYLVLQPQLVDELCRDAGFDGGQRALGAPDFAFGHALFESARRGALAQDPLRGEELAVEFARRVLGVVPPPRSPRRQPRWDAVARAKRVIAERLDAPLSLSEVARRAHVSPYHLTRQFRERTGLALHQYAMALRARRCLLELERYRGRLDLLAMELGYSGLPHLSRCFRQAFGVGPREWLHRASHKSRCT